MPQAVALLANATRIVIAGFRSCYPAAFSLRYLCSLSARTCTCCTTPAAP